MFNREFTKGFMFDEENDNIVNQYRPNHIGIEIGNVKRCENGIATIKLYEPLKIGDGIRILNNHEDVGLTITNMFIDRKKVKEATKGDTITIKIDGKVDIFDKVVKTTDKDLIKEIDDLIDAKKRKVKINGKITLFKNEPIKLKIIADDMLIEVASDYLIEDAINSPTTKDRIIKQLNKLGDTPYVFDNLIVDADDDIFVKIDELNDIRRKAIKKLSLKRCAIKNLKKQE